MSKFKVGDNVRVKEGLIIGETYGETLLLKGMFDKRPYESKIIAVMKENLGFAYRLENLYWYSEEMIELFKTTHTSPKQKLEQLGWGVKDSFWYINFEKELYNLKYNRDKKELNGTINDTNINELQLILDYIKENSK